MRTLIFDSHEPRDKQYAHARTALQIFRTLRQGDVVVIEETPTGERLLRLTVDLQPGFALNQPLSPFALAAIELFDPDEETYALDVISVIEATLEDPRQILREQEHRARGEAIQEMKADGIEYDERMELLESITYPKPLEELLGEAFDAYTSEVPWARDYELSPKSVVRDMIEQAFGFRDMVSHYGLGRSEGSVLRYLSDAYRALTQTVPADKKTAPLEDLIEWLGELVRQVDSSLIDEWETLQNPDSSLEALQAAQDVTDLTPPARSVVENRRAFTVMIRNAMFQRVQHTAFDRLDALSELEGPGGYSRDDWADALDRFFAEYDEILIDAEARAPKLCRIDDTEESEGIWRVRQVIHDPAGNHDWAIEGVIDLTASAEAGEPVIRIERVGEIGV